ncbi:MAG: hypothetical protein OXE77_05435 [Flavobacteriaceae bacterium]|nr:hypothetical protein [Flavobacteriaceae bacterium]MCY4267470.1 hypothetical protein [Flavobacteriaceae bacterium]MCY4299154.1 hypothetical protein [Flavobacteriaceae bacterium]
MKNQPATKKDVSEFKSEIKKEIQDLINPIREDIREMKTDIRGLHSKFDTLNYRTGRHGGTINVHTTIIILLIATLVTKIASFI